MKKKRKAASLREAYRIAASFHPASPERALIVDFISKLWDRPLFEVNRDVHRAAKSRRYTCQTRSKRIDSTD